jgi:hypothetical protein
VEVVQRPGGVHTCAKEWIRRARWWWDYAVHIGWHELIARWIEEGRVAEGDKRSCIAGQHGISIKGKRLRTQECRA